MRKNNKKTNTPSNDFLNYADAKTKTIKEGKAINISNYNRGNDQDGKRSKY